MLRSLLIAALLLPWGSSLLAQVAAPCLDRPPEDRPYTREHLLDVVKSQTPRRAEYLIRTCGIRATFNQELETELRAAGAEDSVIASVRDVALKAAVNPGPSAPAQGAPVRTWKTLAEYNLGTAALSDTKPESRLPRLDAWKSAYPVTDFESERLQSYLVTYQALNKPIELFATAKQLSPKDRDNLASLVALTVFVYRLPQPPSAEDLAMADRAAGSLLANGNNYFAAARKSQPVTDEQWAATKKQTLEIAQNCVAWIAAQRKDWQKAEVEFTKVLQLQPANLQATYALATAMINQKRGDKFSAALFHLSRAAHYTGPGALTESQRKTVQDYLEEQYAKYHGDLSDFDKLAEIAIANVFPPEGFTVSVRRAPSAQ